MKISLRLFFCLALSWPVAAFAREKSPLVYRVLENGMITVSDATHEVLKIDPEVFTGLWEWHSFSADTDPSDGTVLHGVCRLDEKHQVDSYMTVQPSDGGLRIHYQLIPRQTIPNACQARIPLYFHYDDWFNSPYELDGRKARLPQRQVAGDTVIDRSDAYPLTLGPSASLDGLKVKVGHIRCELILMDDRKWTSSLVVSITHDEPFHQNWTWPAGEKKDFDITLTFNRPLSAGFAQPPKRAERFAGCWQGTFSPGTQFENGRLSACIVRGDRGDYRAHFNFDESYLAFLSNSTPKVVVHGHELKAVYGNGVDLVLNWDHAQGLLSGKVHAWGHEGSFTLRRGMAAFVPRLDPDQKPVTAYVYQEPKDLGGGLAPGDLSQDDAALASLSRAVRAILDERLPNIHSFLVVHDSKLLMDEYFYGYGPEDPHPLYSVTKSLFSTLFGIAQDHGWVDVNDKLYDLYPEYRKRPDWDPHKNSITLGMVLAMDSGFQCDNLADSCGMGIYSSSDWVDYTLSLPLGNVPGNHWVYNGTSLIPLANWIIRRSGMSFTEFAKKYLDDPLGIKAYPWELGPNQVPRVDADQYLTPREMAKLGLLYLDQGRWKGRQVLSADWVRKATSPETAKEPRAFDYGYLWWIKEGDHQGKKVRIIEANGWAGQYIFIVPELKLVCVMTAGNYPMGSLMGLEEDFFKKYVLGAF